MLSEARERFLKAILAEVPLERVVEVHLFPAIRQGQMETGVAVVAAIRPTVAILDEVEFGAPAELTAEPLEPAVADDRLVVYSASYRLTRKGIDRGKWEVDVTLEADAPFATVAAVVRGVQERAGEALDPQRLTHAELEALTAEPMWQLASA